MKNSPNFKKFLAGTVSTAVVASAFTPAASAAASFKDIGPKFWAKAEIDKLVEEGVINGYPDGTFKPGQNLIRGQAANLLANALALPKPDNLKVWPDVSEKSAFAVGAAATKKAGIFGGNSSGKFGPTDVLTREQMASVLVKAFDLKNTGESVSFSDMNKISASHKDNVIILAQNKITTGKGDGRFDPKAPVNRATFVTFLYRAMDQAGYFGDHKVDPVPVIEKVEAEGSNQLKLTGVALQHLDKTAFTLEGNTVQKVEPSKDGTSLTLTFDKALTPNKDQKLTVVVEVNGKKKTSEYNFNYKFEAKTVSGSTDRVQANSAGQKLGVAVNGQETNLDFLKAAGYTVEFQATQDVFANKETGELKANLAEGTTFSYRVILTKDGKAIQSELKSVSVTKLDQIVKTITSYDVVRSSDGQKLTSGRLAPGENAAIKGLKGVNAKGETVDIPAATYTSSDSTIALINANGVITPIRPGTVTFTIKAGDAVKEVTMTVDSAAREINKVTPSKPSVKLVRGGTSSVNLTVLDQFGDPISAKGLTVAETVKTGNDLTIATVTSNVSDSGAMTLGIKGDTTNSGTGKLEIKGASGKVLSVIDVTVGAAGDPIRGELHPVKPDQGTIIDLFSGNKSLQFTFEQYDANDFPVGPAKNFGTGAKYTVVSTDPSIAKVSTDSNGTITVTGASPGTAAIQVKEGDVVRESVNIVVSNSAPEFKNVIFTNMDSINDARAYKLTEFVNVDTVSVAGQKATISNNGDIYIDKNANGTFDAEADLKLGDITVTSNNLNLDIANASLGKAPGAAAFAIGDRGQAVIGIKPVGQTTPAIAKTINIDVR